MPSVGRRDLSRSQVGGGGVWAALPLVALAACDAPEPTRHQPTVEVVDGVEIATLGPIPGPFDPDYLWTFRVVKEVRTVLPGSTDPLLFDPAAVEQLRDGRLLVHDPSAERPLVIVDPDTEAVVARFGSTGQGPGELSRRLVLSESREGLLVLDLGNRQVHRFDAEGAPLGSVGLDIATAAPNGVAAAGGSGFVVETVVDPDRTWVRSLVLIDPWSGSARPFADLPEPSGPAAGIFNRGRVLWTSTGGGLVSMWAYLPSVRVHAADGTLIREIRLPFTRRVMTPAEIEAQIAQYGEIARGLRPGPMGLTNVLYATGDTVFGMFLAGMWRAAEDPVLPPGIWWRLFTLRGAYVGVVEQPEDFRYLGQGDATFWARVLDENAYPVLQELGLVRVAPAQGRGDE